MNTAQVYFIRNQGSWDWNVRFAISDWGLFFRRQQNIGRKIVFATFVVISRLLSGMKARTEVILTADEYIVNHITIIHKLGIDLMRSEKTFHIQPDGTSLILRGQEFYWPRLKHPVPFTPTQGHVNSNTTSANYRMPLFGDFARCDVKMEPSEATIAINSEWFQGHFDLTRECLDRLRLRF